MWMPLQINTLRDDDSGLRHDGELLIRKFCDEIYTFDDKVVEGLSFLIKCFHLTINKFNSLCMNPSCTILDRTTTLISSLELVRYRRCCYLGSFNDRFLDFIFVFTQFLS